MRCIWQMDGDKVKGFKCDFSPIDMLIILSGLKCIVADIERHPKDRERAQGIYNQIMLCRYYDEADRKTENSSEKPNNCKYAENPSSDVWECGCFLDTYCEHQIYDRNPDGTINIVKCGYEPKDEPTGYNLSPVDKDINVRSKDEPKLSEIPTSKCHYEPTDEPQTEEEILREQCRAFMGIVEQTERSE